MAKPKYKFNPDSLSFDKISLGLKAILLRSFAYFVGSLIIAAIYGLIFSVIFDSPEEKALKRELSQLKLQYDMVNREMDDIEKVLGHLQETDDNLYRTIFGAEPLQATLRQGGVGGVNRFKELEGYNNSNLIIATAQRLDALRKKVYVQSKSYDDLIKLATEKEDMLCSIPAILPISVVDLTRIASGFGLRIHPVYKISKFHAGMDFTAPSEPKFMLPVMCGLNQLQDQEEAWGIVLLLIMDSGIVQFMHTSIIFNVRPGQKYSAVTNRFVGNTECLLHHIFIMRLN
jgi:Asp-tRNA(Asn)/Glu-tRNA(Gln) amidotransferase C subunit